MKYQIIIFFLLFCISLFIFNTDFGRKNKKENNKKKKKTRVDNSQKKDNKTEKKKDTTTTTTKKKEIKEKFISKIPGGMDDVLDNYCKITSQNDPSGMILDDYRSSSELWKDTVDYLDSSSSSNAECKLSQCPTETCYILEPKRNNTRSENFPEHEYYMYTQPEVLNEDNGTITCVSSHNADLNILCDGTQPQACRSYDQDQQNTTAWEFNESIKRWERKEFNHYLDSDGACHARDSSTWNKKVEVYDGVGPYTGNTTLPVYYINKGPDCIIREQSRADELRNQYINDYDETITFASLNSAPNNTNPESLFVSRGKTYFVCKDNNDQIVEYGHDGTSTGFDCGIIGECGVCAFQKYIKYQFIPDTNPEKRRFEEKHFIQTFYHDGNDFAESKCDLYEVNMKKIDQYIYPSIDASTINTILDEYLLSDSGEVIKRTLQYINDEYQDRYDSLSDDIYTIRLMGHDIIELQAYYINNNIDDDDMVKFDCLRRPTQDDSDSSDVFNILNILNQLSIGDDLQRTIDILNNSVNRFTHNLKNKYITENILEIDDVRLDMFYDIKLKEFHGQTGSSNVYCIVDPDDNKTILTESILIVGEGVQEIRYEFTQEPSFCDSKCPIGKEVKTIMNQNRCVPCQSNTEYYNIEKKVCYPLPGCPAGSDFSPFQGLNDDYGYITFDNGIPTQHTSTSTSPLPTRDYVLFAQNENSIPTDTCDSCGTNMYQPKYNSLDKCKVCQQQGNLLKYVNTDNSTCDTCTSTRRNGPGTKPKIRTKDTDDQYHCTDCPTHPVDSDQKFAIYSEENECRVECPEGRKYGENDEKIIIDQPKYKTITYNEVDSTFTIPECDWKCGEHMTKNVNVCDDCPIGTQKTKNDNQCVPCQSGMYNDEPGKSCKPCPLHTSILGNERPWSPDGASNITDCQIQCVNAPEEQWVPHGVKGYLLSDCDYKECNYGWRRMPLTTDEADLDNSGGFIAELVKGEYTGSCTSKLGDDNSDVIKMGTDERIKDISDVCNELSTSQGMNYGYSRNTIIVQDEKSGENINKDILYCCPNTPFARTSFNGRKCECEKRFVNDQHYENVYNTSTTTCVESCKGNMQVLEDGCGLMCEYNEYPDWKRTLPTCVDCPPPPEGVNVARYNPTSDFDEKERDANARLHCQLTSCIDTNYELKLDNGNTPTEDQKKYDGSRWLVTCQEKMNEVPQWTQMGTSEKSGYLVDNPDKVITQIDGTEYTTDQSKKPSLVEVWEQKFVEKPLSDIQTRTQRENILYSCVSKSDFENKYTNLTPNIAVTCAGTNVLNGLDKKFCCPSLYPNGSIQVKEDNGSRKLIPRCCLASQTFIDDDSENGNCCDNVNNGNNLDDDVSRLEKKCVYDTTCSVIKSLDHDSEFVKFQIQSYDVNTEHTCIKDNGSKMCYKDFYQDNLDYGSLILSDGRPDTGDNRHCATLFQLTTDVNCYDIDPTNPSTMYHCCLDDNQEYDSEANDGDGGCVDKQECWINDSGDNLFSSVEMSTITYSIDPSPTVGTECKTIEERRQEAQDLCEGLGDGFTFDYPPIIDVGEDSYEVTCTPPTPVQVYKTCYLWKTDTNTNQASVKYEKTTEDTVECLENDFKYDSDSKLKDTDNVDLFCENKKPTGHTYVNRAAVIDGDELTCNYDEDQETVDYPCYQEINRDYIFWNSVYGKRYNNYFIQNTFGDDNVGDRGLRYYDLLDNVTTRKTSLDSTKRDDQHIGDCIKKDDFDQSQQSQIYKQNFYNLLQNEVWFQKTSGGSSEGGLDASEIGNSPNRYGSDINTQCAYDFAEPLNDSCDRVYDIDIGNSAKTAGMGKIETNCQNETDIFILNDIFTPYVARDSSQCKRSRAKTEEGVVVCGFSPTGHNKNSGGGCKPIITSSAGSLQSDFCKELGGDDENLELIIARVQDNNPERKSQVLGCFKKVAEESFFEKTSLYSIDPMTMTTDDGIGVSTADSIYDVYEKMDIVDQYYDSDVILEIIKDEYPLNYKYVRASDKIFADRDTYDNGSAYDSETSLTEGLIRKAYIDYKSASGPPYSPPYKRYIIPRKTKPSDVDKLGPPTVDNLCSDDDGTGGTGDTCCEDYTTFYVCKKSIPQESYAAFAASQDPDNANEEDARIQRELEELEAEEAKEALEATCKTNTYYYETSYDAGIYKIDDSQSITSELLKDLIEANPNADSLFQEGSIHSSPPVNGECQDGTMSITKYYLDDYSGEDTSKNCPGYPTTDVDSHKLVHDEVNLITVGTECVPLTCPLTGVYYETNANGTEIMSTQLDVDLESLWEDGTTYDPTSSSSCPNHYITKYYVYSESDPYVKDQRCPDYPDTTSTDITDILVTDILDATRRNLVIVETRCVDLYCNYDKLNIAATTPNIFVDISSIVDKRYTSSVPIGSTAEVVVGTVEFDSSSGKYSDYSQFTQVDSSVTLSSRQVQLNAIKNKYDQKTKNRDGVDTCGEGTGEILVGKYALYNPIKCYPDVTTYGRYSGTTQSDAESAATSGKYLFNKVEPGGSTKYYHLYETKCIDVNCDTTGEYPGEYEYKIEDPIGSQINPQVNLLADIYGLEGNDIKTRFNAYCISDQQNDGNKLILNFKNTISDSDQQCNVAEGDTSIDDFVADTCDENNYAPNQGFCRNSAGEVYFTVDSGSLEPSSFTNVKDATDYSDCTSPIAIYDKYKYCSDDLPTTANTFTDYENIYIHKETCRPKLQFYTPGSDPFENDLTLKLLTRTTQSGIEQDKLLINIYPSSWVHEDGNSPTDISKYLLSIEIPCHETIYEGTCVPPTSLIDRGAPANWRSTAPSIDLYWDETTKIPETDSGGLINLITDFRGKYSRLNQQKYPNKIWFRFPTNSTINQYHILLIEVPIRVSPDYLKQNQTDLIVKLELYHDGNQFINQDDLDPSNLIYASGETSSTLRLEHGLDITYNYMHIYLPNTPTPSITREDDWIQFKTVDGVGGLHIRIPWDIYNLWPDNLIKSSTNKLWLYIEIREHTEVIVESPPPPRKPDIIQSKEPILLNKKNEYITSYIQQKRYGNPNKILLNFSNLPVEIQGQADYLELMYTFEDLTIYQTYQNKKMEIRFSLHYADISSFNIDSSPVPVSAATHVHNNDI
jgi:hypothetical protein